MNTTALYQKAVASLTDRHAVATADLQDGSTVFCCISKVAGRSIVKGHYRTEWRHKLTSEVYSRRISHTKAAKLFAAHN